MSSLQGIRSDHWSVSFLANQRPNTPNTLVAENRQDHKTPVAYRCYNRRCEKYSKYVSVLVFRHARGGAQPWDSERLTYLHEVQLEALKNTWHSTNKTGTANCAVETDESKFGKRKFNRSIVGRNWVLGGTCRQTAEILVALYPDNKRNTSTLISTIEGHADEHLTVITDCWKTHNELEQQKLDAFNCEPYNSLCQPYNRSTQAEHWINLVAAEKKSTFYPQREWVSE